ncbi:MAG: DNA topoisomerase VI subunit B [Nitrososphaeraceae archaeon]
MKSSPTLEVKYQEKGKKNYSVSNNNLDNKKIKIKYNKKAESEFFVDNSALAGFTGERILYMAIRELIENSLDSCEANHILPEILIEMKHSDQTNDLWSISCTDNGVGIPAEKVPVAVCSFLTSGKYVEKQQRGLFGVGLKMIAAFSTKDTDTPIKVWSKDFEEKIEYYHELRTDISTNKPIVLEKKIMADSDSLLKTSHGFKIYTTLRARLSPITKSKIYDYVTQSSIVNPYANITFENDEGKITFKRRTDRMPEPAKEVLPHPADMDLQTLKKAILNFKNQKTTIQGVLSNSFQKLSSEKAKEIIVSTGIKNKPADQYSEQELIKIVNICKHTKFQSPNTDHLSPIGEQILTAGMMSEYTIVNNKEQNSGKNEYNDQNMNLKILKPALTSYSSRSTVINNRPTIIECGIAYGGDISSFKLYRFANKIPLLYDEGSDVAREVVSEVNINKMGITKKDAREKFSQGQNNIRSDRVAEFLPIHIFFHICSTKIPYKSAGKESIASEGDMKKYMKFCLSDLYRKVSAQIRKDLKIKEAENRLRLYKFYIPLITEAISETISVDIEKLNKAFNYVAEKHVKKEIIFKENKNFNSKEDDNKTGKNIFKDTKKNEIIYEHELDTLEEEKEKKDIKVKKISKRKKFEKTTLYDFSMR